MSGGTMASVRVARMSMLHSARSLVGPAYALCLVLLLATAACAGGDSTLSPAGSGQVASVEVSKPQLTIGVGSTVALQLVVRDASGRALSDRAVTWTSSDPTVATVSALGVVSALRIGVVQIAATVEGRSAVTNITIAPKTVASVQVQPSELRLLVGGSVQLSARTLDDSGAPLVGRPVVWISSDSRIAVVDTTGRVTALAPGIATLTATSEGRSVFVGVSVTLVPVARIDVSPATDTIVVGQSTQFSAVLRDSVGASLGERGVSWGTSDVGVATVSSAGLVIGVAPGVATITAASSGRTADVRIVVRPRPVGSVIVSPGQAALIVGGTVRLTVQVTDENGTLLSGRSVTYRSENNAIATVGADGTITGIAAGATAIVVTSEGRSGRVNVAVSPVPVASIRINPGSMDLTVGETTRLAVVLQDGSGVTLTGRAISWTSGAPGVATVSSDGTVRAIGPGTAVVLATAEGRTATTNITVRAVPVGKVTVTPSSGIVIIGDALDLTAEIRDADGVQLTDRVVLWTSGDERLAVVSSAGRVRALAAGTLQVRASVDGVSGASSITVIVEPVLAVTVEPGSLTLTLPSRAGQLVATPRGRNGIALSNRVIAFASADTTIATVSPIGRVSPVRAGSTNIVVLSEGRQVIVPVTVLRAPVATVTPSLASASVFVGQTTTGTALLKDEDGNVLTGRTVTWTSSNAAVATVSGSGVVSALSPGTATITATSEEKSGTVVLTVTPSPVASLSVSLGDATLIEGTSTQATATLRDAGGATLTGRTVAWSSSNTAVATVSATGIVSAIRAGTATITATSEGQSANAAVTVSPPPVASVAVTLGNPSLPEGATTLATAALRDANGVALSGRTVTWSTSAPGTATVSSAGIVTAVRAGNATITATSEGRSGSATLTVTIPPPASVASVTANLANSTLQEGATTQATAVLKDAAGNTLTGRTVVWSSSNATVASVSSGGLVTAIRAGTATITGVSEGRSDGISLTVTAPPPIPVASVTVTLSDATVQVGETVTAAAVTRSAAGTTLTGRTITWTSSNAAVATVSSTGVVTALAAGSASIVATSENRSGSATLTVSAPPPAPVASVTVTLADASLVQGETTQASAVPRAANGTALTGRSITWTSSAPSVATVSSSGLVTAVSAGSATISATSENRTGSAALTVSAPTPVPVASVAVALSNTNVQAGGTVTATATTRDAGGNVLTGRTVTWASSNTGVATVSSTGIVTTLTAGTATITATSESRSGSASLTVTPPPPVPVATVTVSPTSASLMEGATGQAVAVTRDANGNVLTGRTVAWASSNTLVATVSATGLVSALRPGAVTITATSEGRSGTGALTVTATPVATVTVALGSNPIQEGATTTATATMRNENGVALAGRTVTWASSNTTVATVSSTGVVTALRAGSATITATSETKSGSALLTVNGPSVSSITVTLANGTIDDGTSTTASAVLRDASGATLTGRPVTWTSSDPGVASVSSSGVVTSLFPGTTVIRATSGAVSGTATLTVREVSIGRVEVSPATATIFEKGSASERRVQLTARVFATNGRELFGRPVTWFSTRPTDATVSATGLVTAVKKGSSDIRASYNNQTGTARITVEEEDDN